MPLEVGQTLAEAVGQLGEADIRAVISSLAEASIEVAGLCRQGLSHKTSTTNAFGDQQLALDVEADAAMMRALRASGVVRVASSEETPREVEMASDASLVVAFDPLDGSSIIPCNWAVGSIAGVWRGERLVGASGEDMVGAVITVYGPRTTMYVAVRRGWGENRVIELTLGEGETWVVSKVVAGLGEKNVFAPANLRATNGNAGYARLVGLYMRERYTLRYTGGMVPDVTQLVVKGGGVFVSPVSAEAPAKLRLAYEVMPMAFLVEMCGGASSDGVGGVLRRTVTECEERTGVCVGSRAEVARFEEHCGGTAMQ